MISKAWVFVDGPGAAENEASELVVCGVVQMAENGDFHPLTTHCPLTTQNSMVQGLATRDAKAVLITF